MATTSAEPKPSSLRQRFFFLVVPVILIAVLRAASLFSEMKAVSLRASNLSQNGRENFSEYSYPERILWCGYPLFLGKKNYSIASALFPEVETVLKYNDIGMHTTANDLLILSAGGPCPLRPPALQETFPGKILFLHGANKKSTPESHERLYSLGPLPESNHTVHTTYGALHLVTFPLNVQQTIYKPQLKPKNNGKYFLLYLASHCVMERERAFHQLAQFGTVHYGGSCKGQKVNRQVPVNASIAPFQRQKGEWANNRELFLDYRFALVMENSYQEGYITEKIINAFLGGAVPIYYGTREIFDIFNRDAFVFYDLQHPEEALKKISYLEANRSAYLEVLQAPILAHGEETIRNYFSFQDEVGGGLLKWRIRSKLGFSRPRPLPPR